MTIEKIHRASDKRLRDQITAWFKNLQAQITALAVPETNNQLLSGSVTWITGLTFQVSDCVFIINGTVYTSDAEQVTLAAADGTNPRIDVFAANIDGTADVITGTPAADPIKPEIDPNTQVEISFALVAAGATTPSGVTNENVYQENIEWTSAVSGGTVSAANAASPYAGTLAIRFNAAANGAFITLTDSASNGPLAFALFAFRIKNIAYGTSNNVRARIALYSTATRVSNWIDLRHGTYGFNGTDTTNYQLIQIPVADFVLGGNTFNRVRIEVAANGANTLSFYLDDMFFQTSQDTPLTGVVYTTTNQTISDIKTFTSDPIIPDEAYGVGWNGVLEPPTKNAVYDKIELLIPIFTCDVDVVANTDYVLWYDAPFAGTVTLIRTESTSGTCTLTGKVNTTALGGTANSVSSTASEQAHASSNTFVKGDKLQFTISSNSACLNLAAAFYLTRTS